MYSTSSVAMFANCPNGLHCTCQHVHVFSMECLLNSWLKLFRFYWFGSVCVRCKHIISSLLRFSFSFGHDLQTMQFYCMLNSNIHNRAMREGARGTSLQLNITETHLCGLMSKTKIEKSQCLHKNWLEMNFDLKSFWVYAIINFMGNSQPYMHLIDLEIKYLHE